MSGAPSAAFGAGLLAARLALEGLGQLDARRAHPQALEVVELPHRHVEDVDHDVAVVQQHPLRVRQSLDRERPLAERPQEVLLDGLRDRLHLRVGAAAADDEVVGDRGEPARLQHHQVVGLVVEGGAGALERPLPAAETGHRRTYSSWNSRCAAMYASTGSATRTRIERTAATEART